MEPVLFYGVPQGCSFGSIVALEWLGRPYRLCRVEMLEAWPAGYERLNPKMQTPVLLTGDGRMLTESLAILQHLAAQDLGPQGLGRAQGTPEHDRLNERLAFLNTDFFGSFSPLWTAYDRNDLDDGAKALLRELGTQDVHRVFKVLDGLLAGRAWLVDDRRSVADAYLSGVARWADYLRVFDTQAEYPNVAAHLRKLRADPAVAFADAVERQAPATSTGAFRGHVSAEEAMSAWR